MITGTDWVMKTDPNETGEMRGGWSSWVSSVFVSVSPAVFFGSSGPLIFLFFFLGW